MYPSRMDLQLDGKLALVSGSTAGIGYAIAEALGNGGAHVTVNGRTLARVEAAVQKLQDAGVRAAPFALRGERAQRSPA